MLEIPGALQLTLVGGVAILVDFTISLACQGSYGVVESVGSQLQWLLGKDHGSQVCLLVLVGPEIIPVR